MEANHEWISLSDYCGKINVKIDWIPCNPRNKTNIFNHFGRIYDEMEKQSKESELQNTRLFNQKIPEVIITYSSNIIRLNDRRRK